MISKTAPHQYYFESQANWVNGRKVVLSATDVKGTITAATPPEFAGGIKDIWSPEHLLLASVCSCFITTFLAIAEKKRLKVTRLECNAIGYISLVEGHLEFTEINLYPKIMMPDEQQFDAAGDAIAKTHKHCIISNSLKSKIIYHDAVMLDKHPVEKSFS